MSKPVFLSADWRHLCLLNYEIDPSILIPHLPYGTELDFRDGKTFVSLVAFMFYQTKMFGQIPAFFHQTFEEINLRFYVLRRNGNEVRRGVVFIKEIVPKPILAWIARTFYHENYIAMKTNHQMKRGESYFYQWGDSQVQIESDGKVLEAIPGSAERWITEHYWGYTKISDQKSYEYEVKHPVWNLYQVKRCNLRADIAGLYGKEFESTFQNPPTSVFLADGSPVTVHFPSVIR